MPRVRATRAIVIGGGLMLMGAVVAYFVALGQVVPAALLLRDLDPSFEVTAGQDPGGAWPLVGEVTDAEVCGGRGDSRICATPGSSADVRARLARAAEATQRITLSARVRSVSEGQREPARIVSFAGGREPRNATIGLEYDEILLSHRSARTGPHGAFLEFYLPRAVRDTQWTRVFASLDSGRVELRASDAGGARIGRYEFGMLEAWLLGPVPGYTSRLVPGVMLRARVLAAALLFLPLGMLGGWLLPRRALAVPAAAAAAPLLLLIAEHGIWFGSGASRYVVAASAAALGAILARGRSNPVARTDSDMVADTG